MAQTPLLTVNDLNAYFGDFQAIRNVSLDVYPKEVVALIGPSGCGKSTFLRCLNRLHEEVPGARVTGDVVLQGKNIYAPGANPVEVRANIGMVFQKPNPFPSMTIFENVAAGLIFAGVRKRSALQDVVERCLKQSALWEEVKDKLNKPGMSLSGGQQQRLCIARALAVQPPVILMDEPTSALDPISTAKIEELVSQLKDEVTIVMVTHNMQQAARVSDKTAFFLLGDMVEFEETTTIFSNPKNEQTERYVSGRFG